MIPSMLVIKEMKNHSVCVKFWRKEEKKIASKNEGEEKHRNPN